MGRVLPDNSWNEKISGRTSKYYFMKIKTLKNKADKLIQVLARAIYSRCYCGADSFSCGHHFVHRSQSLSLRWDIKNIVPVSNECHCKIHRKNDPIDILNMVSFMNGRWGSDWESYIIQKRNEVFKPSIGRMTEVIEGLHAEIDKLSC